MSMRGPRGKNLSKTAMAARDRRILAALDGGLSVREVAKLYGVSPTRVTQIRKDAETQRS